MPQRDSRQAITSTIFVLLALLHVLPAVMAEHRYDTAVQNLSPSSTGNLPDVTIPTKFMIIERQLPSNVITLPLPLPTPIPLATNPSPLPNGSPIPLLISPYIPSSAPSSVSLSRTSSSSAFVASKTFASAQFSPSSNSNATTNSANGSNRLTAINFLPFIILTSFFIILLMGWCLHGWCTRRPKEKFVAMGTKESRKRRGGWFWKRKGEEPDKLVCGPAYVSFVGQDVEEFATVSGRYRWPRLSVTNQDHRHHIPRDNHDDEDPFLSKSVPLEFAGVSGQTIRSVPSDESPRGPNVGKRLLSPTTTTGPMSPTSIALRDLYEVVLRNEYDSSSAGGAEERTSLLGVGSGVLSANRSTSGRKRKGHVRRGSESQDEATQLQDLGDRWRGGILPDDDGDQGPQKKLEVRNPSVGEGRLGLREEAGDEILDEEDYMPLPTPTRVQFAVGDPPRGWKAGANAMPNSEFLPFSFPTKDVLPAHPRQIMSPPLESQFYFLPLPTTMEQIDMRNVGPVVGSPARSRGRVRPKSTASNSSVKISERNRAVQNLSEVVDSTRGLATASPLRTAPGEVRRDTSMRHKGASKGKGKLVKPSPAARSSVKRQAGED